MIYVVSGYRRSGTSAMMKALHEGMAGQGIATAYQPGQNKIGAKPEDGYIPNPSELWEIGQYWYMNPAFLRGLPDNTLAKILFDGLLILPRRQYTIVYMHRDPVEIQASCDRVDRHLRQVGVQENPEKGYPFDCFRPYRQVEIDHVLDVMEVRADVHLVHVQFKELVNDPLSVFEALRDHGIPVNPERAAAVINPEHYRYRASEIDDNSASRDARPRPHGDDQTGQKEGGL